MKIAVVGTGISGMVAAYLLCEDHDIVVFEANDYVGGHTHTVDIDLNGTTYPVDTGFIVFNERNYPNFVRLMNRLGVAWQPSRMSFSVQSETTGLEYSPSSLNGLFAQRRNLFRPSFYRMVVDVLRFRRESERLLRDPDDTMTLGAYLEEKRYSKAFMRDFLIPMGAAIWSADPVQFHRFPARYFVQFFKNHGFLNVRDQPQWVVIRRGSRRYVEKLTRSYRDRIRLKCPVQSVRRFAEYVEVRPLHGEVERFDQLIIATHSDQALAMLEDPSDMERRVLGTFPYQENLAVLHTDASFLPRRKAAWASWNYLIPHESAGRVSVTYDMNILQSLRAPAEFCVTLNPARPVNARKILRELTYHHPVYTTRGPVAQRHHHELNGRNRTFFCGAYWGYGFHEDGVNSALAVCRHFGKTL